MDTTETQREMPRYRCHKTVWALKIKNVTLSTNGDATTWAAALVFEDEGYAPVFVDEEFMRKHDPQPGGYYVVYKDGYRSFSPAEAFEEGYAKLRGENEDDLARQFQEVVEPVMRYLAENYHPHTMLLVESTSAELFEGRRRYASLKFIEEG